MCRDRSVNTAFDVTVHWGSPTLEDAILDLVLHRARSLLAQRLKLAWKFFLGAVNPLAALVASFAYLPIYSLSSSCGFLAGRYDLRMLKAQGLLELIGQTYAYRLTDKGIRAGTLFILFHKRVCGPLANSLFQHRPKDRSPQPTKIEKAYHHADTAVQHLIDLLAA
jgi:hypothetical protein